MSTIDPAANRRSLLAMLRIALTGIERTDPSHPGNAGRFTVAHEREAYRLRNAQVYKALGLATALGFPAGVQPSNPGAPDADQWVLAYIDLPDAGQVSWHLPAYAGEWDHHTTEEKYQRTRAFGGSSPLQRSQFPNPARRP